MICVICNKRFDNIKSFTNHIAFQHKIKIKDYYDNNLKNLYEEYCNNPWCVNELHNRPNYTKFNGVSLGYREFCSIKCSNLYNKTKFLKCETINICEYGCGQIAKFINPKSGKFCCSDIWEKCPSSKIDISNRFKGKLRKHIYKKIVTKDMCNYGCGTIANYKFNNGKICCSKHTSSCKGNKKFKSKSVKVLYFDNEYLKNRQNGLNMKPNLIEIHMLNILNYLFPDEFEYVGDFKDWIGGKNPDFKHKNKQILIEVFGDYWHDESKTGISNQIHERERIAHFNNHGYETLIIWESEFKNIEQLKKKLIQFIKERI